MRAASRAASFFTGFGLGAVALYVALVWSGALRSPVPAPSAPPPASQAIAPSPAATPPASPPLADAQPPPGTTFVPEPPPFTFPPGPAPETPPPLDVPFANEPPRSVPGPAPDLSDFDRLRARALAIPVQGKTARDLQDNFAEMRGGRSHEAIDILAPRGTPVVAVAEGTVKKLFTSVPGGLTVYEFDPEGTYSYYYAHLDRYADGLAEGKHVGKGEVIGYVGTTGNAPAGTPHLHFTIFRLGPEKRWWEGTPINPYPLWALAK